MADEPMTLEVPSSITSSIRLVCVDDHATLTQALCRLFAFQADLRVVATGRNTDDFRRLVLEHRPDVALVDLHMPGTIVLLDTVRELARSHPATKVIVYSGDDVRGRQREVREAGAVAFISKGAEPTAILQTIRMAGRPPGA